LSAFFILDLRLTIKSVGNIDSIFVSKKNCFLNKRIVVVLDDKDWAEVVFWGHLVSFISNLASYGNFFLIFIIF